MQELKIKRVFTALEQSWSLESSTRWTKANPALGQCGVTALVVQDYLGGEIAKTWVVKPDNVKLWHYYNFIDNEPIDFTISQFDEPINYEHKLSNRNEAFSDTDANQYHYLSSKFEKNVQNEG